MDVAFDNNQRIGLTTRVQNDGTTPMNTSTNVVFIQNVNNTDYQMNAEYKKTEWFDASITKGITEIEKELDAKYFRPYRHEMMEDILEKVIAEITFTNNYGADHLDHVSLRIINDVSNPTVTVSVSTKV